jgi:hypothetical protein
LHKIVFVTGAPVLVRNLFDPGIVEDSTSIGWAWDPMIWFNRIICELLWQDARGG